MLLILNTGLDKVFFRYDRGWWWSGGCGRRGRGGGANLYIKEQCYPWSTDTFVTLSAVPGQSDTTGHRSLRGHLELEDTCG